MHSAAALNYICTTAPPQISWTQPVRAARPPSNRASRTCRNEGKKTRRPCRRTVRLISSSGGGPAVAAGAVLGGPLVRLPRTMYARRPARSEGLVCVCAILSYTKGSATRIRVTVVLSWTGRVFELVTRLGTRATRGNMAILGGDLFVFAIGEGEGGRGEGGWGRGHVTISARDSYREGMLCKELMILCSAPGSGGLASRRTTGWSEDHFQPAG